MSEGRWEWSDNLSTAITFLDDEHRQLALNYLELIQDVKCKTDFYRFAEDFRKLAADTRAHFVHEERVMRNINYPNFSEHKIAHDRLLADLADFLDNIGEGFAQHDFHALAEYFKYWFLDHVREHDVQLKSFIDRSD